MSQSKPHDGRPASTSVDAAFDALASRRRREVLAVLADHGGPISETALVSRIVASERNASDVPEQEHSRVHTSLHHAHLPRLADAGLVVRDLDRREVRATDHPVSETRPFDSLVGEKIFR